MPNHIEKSDNTRVKLFIPERKDFSNEAQNYINDTGMNNKMTQFFNSISDYKKAAEWLSKYSTGLSIPIILNKNE